MQTKKLDKNIFIIKYYIISLIRSKVEVFAYNNAYIN